MKCLTFNCLVFIFAAAQKFIKVCWNFSFHYQNLTLNLTQVCDVYFLYDFFENTCHKLYHIWKDYCSSCTFVSTLNTAQKMKFSMKDFFSKCDQIRIFLWIWSNLLEKSLIENFIFCTMDFVDSTKVLPS